MTRKQAKELLPIIQAFAEGKKIEYSNDGGYWIETETPTWDTDYVYRIKPEPKYRSFRTQEECWNEMQKHPNFGWVVRKETGNYAAVMSVTNSNIMFQNDIVYSYNKMMDNYTFTDGEPFGVKDE